MGHILQKVKKYLKVFIHSYKGVHYISPTFQNKVKNHKLGKSVFRHGNCLDNASQELFFE